MPSTKQILKQADIVICSYHPDDAELATQRLEFTIRQMQVLDKKFPLARICVIQSNWTPANRRLLQRASAFAYDTIMRISRVYKAEMHNMVMAAIQGGKSKAVLILGDDVIPTVMDGIIRNPFTTISTWLRYPSRMPAPCIFFSCKGTLRDTYYKVRLQKGERYSNTAAVTDWAILIRNDFQVPMVHLDTPVSMESEIQYYESEGHMASDDPPYQLNSDAMLRFKAAALGYPVLKDLQVFFETFQSTSTDRNSVWYHNRDARRKGVLVTNEFIRQRWPYLFVGTKHQPIWQVRGVRRKALVSAGLLIESRYGLVPNGPLLREQWKQRKSRPKLSDLL